MKPDFEFAEQDEAHFTDDLYYDLFEGGYIKPEEFLTDPEQIKEVKEALDVVENFLEQAQETGALIVY